MYILAKFCFNAKLFQETLEPVALTVRFMASVVMMWPIFCSDTFFNFHLWQIQQIVWQVVAYGRFKAIENFEQSSLKSGRLQQKVAYERWSPTRSSIYSDLT